ncbi:MAG: hypothetical protein CMR00_07855 [[Chlorobium] sp. 445]|nr:MAG: hypothetical protein CMR00_07855 [[Chlorobium] sp. 445]
MNDRFSHQIGDEVLKAVAKILQTSVRSSDLVARYGGEEFVAVFPDANLDQAKHLAEQVRANIEAHDWKEIHTELKVTMSIGVCADINYPNFEKCSPLLTKNSTKLSITDVIKCDTKDGLTFYTCHYLPQKVAFLFYSSFFNSKNLLSSPL